MNYKFYKMDRKHGISKLTRRDRYSNLWFACYYGAFKTGANETAFSGHCGIFFLDPPARRVDYSSITGSCQFSLQFCLTSWIEYLPVAERYRNLKSHLQRHKLYVLTRNQNNHFFIFISSS